MVGMVELVDILNGLVDILNKYKIQVDGWAGLGWLGWAGLAA